MIGRVLVSLIVAGCATQVDAVRPSVSLRYSDVDARQPYAPKVLRDLIVGRTFTVSGKFSGTCAESQAPLFAKNARDDYGTDYVECHVKRATVAVTCAGPCTVTGADVTPTAPGTLTVTIVLTANERYYTETRTFVARLADSMRIENCTEGPRLVVPGTPWPRCHLERPGFTVRVMANGKDLGLPVTVRSGDREVTGTEFALEALIGTTPAGSVADGEYDIDLRYGDLVGRARIVFRDGGQR
jgi:hypothetical protein